MIRIHSDTGKSIALPISAHETTAYLISGSNPSCIATRKKKAISKVAPIFQRLGVHIRKTEVIISLKKTLATPLAKQ